MKKLCLIFIAILLTACGHSDQPQYTQQQYAPPPAQYAQQAPAPVVVQAAPQSDNSGTALIAGAALGAVAMHALSNSGGGRDVAPVQHTSVTHVVNKTVIVNKGSEPPAVAPVASTPAPAPVAPPKYAQVQNPIPAVRYTPVTQPQAVTYTSRPALPAPRTYSPPPSPRPASISYGTSRVTPTVTFRRK